MIGYRARSRSCRPPPTRRTRTSDRRHEEGAGGQPQIQGHEDWSTTPTATTTSARRARPRPRRCWPNYPNLAGIISPTTVGVAAAAQVGRRRASRQGPCHRPRHPEPDAPLHRERHGHGVPAVEPLQRGWLASISRWRHGRQDRAQVRRQLRGAEARHHQIGENAQILTQSQPTTSTRATSASSNSELSSLIVPIPGAAQHEVMRCRPGISLTRDEIPDLRPPGLDRDDALIFSWGGPSAGAIEPCSTTLLPSSTRAAERRGRPSRSSSSRAAVAPTSPCRGRSP